MSSKAWSIEGIKKSTSSKMTDISNEFSMFYVNANRCRFDKVIKNATDLCQQQALLDAPVRQATLCVTFGAPCRGTTFHLLTGRSYYVMISLALSAPVPLATMGVAFGARPNSIPMSTGEVASVGGSAKHVKRPDDVGREAGDARTRSRDELKIFRACP